MDDILKLLGNIAAFLQYFVPGFVFIKIYEFVRCKSGQNIDKGLLLRSAVTSVLLLAIYSYVPFLKDVQEPLQILLYALVSMVLAYFSAKLLETKRFRNFLQKIGVFRTTEDNAWRDAFPDKGHWIRYFDKTKEQIYYGWLCVFEDNVNDPLLILRQYTIEKPDGSVIYDPNDPDETVILRASNARRIIVYPNKTNG